MNNSWSKALYENVETCLVYVETVQQLETELEKSKQKLRSFEDLILRELDGGEYIFHGWIITVEKREDGIHTIKFRKPRTIQP